MDNPLLFISTCTVYHVAKTVVDWVEQNYSPEKTVFDLKRTSGGQSLW